MNLLNVSGVSKREGRNWVLKEITFSQQRFRKIAITGESGSGKTTLLKIVGGLSQPDMGEIIFEEERVKGPSERLIPGQPGIAYLSQHFELRNSYRVEEILAYANLLPEEEAEALYKVCRIDHLLKRKTDQVSGGEKQRIALARLLLTSPRLLLLDEPFSNLDLIHKRVLKSVIRDIGEKLRITCLLVSHDPLDTLSWADEIFVMRDGAIIQRGSPGQIYRQPVNEYAAGLFGSYNLLSVGQAKGLAGGAEWGVKGKLLFIRPEDVKLVREIVAGGKGDREAVDEGEGGGEAVDDGKGGMRGMVNDVLFLGNGYELEVVLLPDIRMIVRTGECDFVKGDWVVLSFPTQLHYITE